MCCPPKSDAEPVKKINEAASFALLSPQAAEGPGEQGYVVSSGRSEQLAHRGRARNVGPVINGISVD